MADEHTIEIRVKLLRQIRTVTEMVDNGMAESEALPTSADLARLFRLNHDTVKKHLKYLKDLALIRIMGMSPKHYKFDAYQFRQAVDNPPDDENARDLIGRLQGTLQI